MTRFTLDKDITTDAQEGDDISDIYIYTHTHTHTHTHKEKESIWK